MSRLPNFPIEGGCACGAVRYKLGAPPACVYTCHCSDCQTLSTSVFSLNGVVATDSLEITQGKLNSWIRTADSGRRIPQFVCAVCGVRIYTEPSAGAPTRTLRLGSLDDTTWLRPAAAIWMKSAQPWVTMPEGTLLYDLGADNFRPIIARWREIMEIA